MKCYEIVWNFPQNTAGLGEIVGLELGKLVNWTCTYEYVGTYDYFVIWFGDIVR